MRKGCGVYNRRTVAPFPAGKESLSLLRNVQTESGSHWASYTTGTKAFPSGKDAR